MPNIIQNITEITNIVGCSQEYYDQQSNAVDPYYETTLYVTTDTNNFYYGARKLSDISVIESYPDDVIYPNDRIYLIPRKDSDENVYGYKVYFKHDNIVTLLEMTGQYIDVVEVTDPQDPVIINKADVFDFSGNYEGQGYVDFELSKTPINPYNNIVVKVDNEVVPRDIVAPWGDTYLNYYYEAPYLKFMSYWRDCYQGGGTIRTYPLSKLPNIPEGCSDPFSPFGPSTHPTIWVYVNDEIQVNNLSYDATRNEVKIDRTIAQSEKIEICYYYIHSTLKAEYQYETEGALWQLKFYLEGKTEPETRNIVLLDSDGRLPSYIYEEMYISLEEFVEENYVTPRWNVKGSGGGSDPYQEIVEEAYNEIIGEVPEDE